MEILDWGSRGRLARINAAFEQASVRLMNQPDRQEIVKELTILQEYFDCLARKDELLRVKAATVHDDVWSMSDDCDIVSLNDRLAEQAAMVHSMDGR